ncbi:hypothetical protein TNCV_1974421, partial [Trichonephila clavipes]
ESSQWEDPQKNKDHDIHIYRQITVSTQNTKSLGKSWDILVIAGPIPSYLEIANAVAGIRLTTAEAWSSRSIFPLA